MRQRTVIMALRTDWQSLRASVCVYGVRRRADVVRDGVMHVGAFSTPLQFSLGGTTVFCSLFCN
jgi:hypothetical protein